MQEKTLLRIAGRIRPLSAAAAVRQMAYEDAEGFYSAWKVTDGQDAYLLKAASENERGIYRRLGNGCDALPRCYGTAVYYKKTYILLEFVAGHDLMRCTRPDLVRVLDAMIALERGRQAVPETVTAIDSRVGMPPTKKTSISLKYAPVSSAFSEKRSLISSHRVSSSGTTVSFSTSSTLKFRVL